MCIRDRLVAYDHRQLVRAAAPEHQIDQIGLENDVFLREFLPARIRRGGAPHTLRAGQRIEVLLRGVVVVAFILEDSLLAQHDKSVRESARDEQSVSYTHLWL